MDIEHYFTKSKTDKIIKKPLSDDDLKEILGSSLKILMYPDLAKYDTIEQLLPAPFDYCVILLVEDEDKHNIEGHWTALLRYDGTYEYFDPYGNPPDFDLTHWLDRKTRLKLHEDKPYLKYLLKNKTYTFNRTRYELLRKGVNTCGHHCAYRIHQFKKHSLTLTEYRKHMVELSNVYGVSYDTIVASFVGFFLK